MTIVVFFILSPILPITILKRISKNLSNLKCEKWYMIFLKITPQNSDRDHYYASINLGLTVWPTTVIIKHLIFFSE